MFTDFTLVKGTTLSALSDLVTEARSARDAAYVNADIYADTAAGLAGTAEGDQFQVVSGTEVIRYSHDAGPVATELARYPLSDLITSYHLTAGAAATAYARAGTGTTYTTRVGFGGWLTDDGSEADGDAIYDQISINVAAAATATKLRLKAWTRVFGVSDEAPGEHVDDVLMADESFALADIGVTAGGDFAEVDLDVPQFLKEDGSVVGVEFWVEDDSAVRQITGTGNATDTVSGLYRLFIRPTESTWSTSGAVRLEVSARSVTTAVEQDGLVKWLRAFASDANTRLFDTALDAVTAKKITDAISSSQTVGRAVDPVTGTTTGNRTFVFADPVSANGFLNSFSIFAMTSGTIAVKRFTRAGDDFTQVGSDVSLNVSSGLNTFTVEDLSDLTFSEGDLVGVYVPLSLAAYTSAAADGEGWYSSATSSGNVSSFTDTLVTTSLRLEMGFDFTVIDAGGGSVTTVTETAVPKKTHGNVGIHGYAARMAYAFDNSTPQTFWACLAVPAEFDAIRLVFGHSTTTRGMTVARASVGVLGAIADTTGATPHNDAVAVTFDGEAGVTIPASDATTNRALVKSDLIPISSIPRTDGGDYPLITVMAYVSSADTLKMIGKSDGTTDMTSWATHPEMPMIYRYDEGDCVTTPANFTDTTNVSTSPILLVEFVARGQVISSAVFGDSISNGEGSGITYNGLGFGFSAAFAQNDAARAASGPYYSHMNLAWSGTQTVGFPDRMRSAFEAGILPDVAVIQAFSPNDISGGVITDANIEAMRLAVAEQLDLCATYGVKPLIWTGIPNDLSDYTTTDLLRQAYNDELREWADRGAVILDFDFVAREATPDANGRYGFVAGFSTDNIHPDDSGHAALGVLLANGIDALGLELPSALVTA